MSQIQELKTQRLITWKIKDRQIAQIPIDVNLEVKNPRTHDQDRKKPNKAKIMLLKNMT